MITGKRGIKESTLKALTLKWSQGNVVLMKARLMV